MTVKGFAFDPDAKTMTFHRGSGETTLVIPDSFPVLLLPDELTLSDVDLEFPDVTKGRVFYHRWNQTVAIDGSFNYQYIGNEYGRCAIAALPQEWDDTTALADAPDGADIFAGFVRLERTVAPSHNWIGVAIPALPIQNQWIPFNGSVLLEANFGFARALSIYIDDDDESPTYRKLVAYQQQSVSTPPGGFGLHHSTYGAPGGEPNSTSGVGSWFGGETTYSTGQGWPVYYPGDTGTPHYRTRSDSGSRSLPPIPVDLKDHRQTGSAPPSLSDTTDYGSTWRIDVRGQFGRRS